MKILVTGGSGVVGAGAIPELLRNGHSVRLLSRGARKDAREYPERVEPFEGDLSNSESVKGAAEGCDVVLHIAGIVEERPPESTFEKVNVAGTRQIVDEAARARVKRLIYVSSLGADTGASAYHQSKRRAEEIVRGFPGEWVVLRPGTVYGPGDQVISMLLKMVRTLPAVPMVGTGEQPFQPLWYEDLGKAIGHCVEESSVNQQIVELAGNELTTTTELLDLLCEITDRRPPRIPVPEWAAKIGSAIGDGLAANAARKAGLPLPINSAKLGMLLEGNFIRPPERNALTNLLHIQPTPLREGLRALADSLPELLPEEGVGTLERKRFWADIAGSNFSASELLRQFCDHVSDIMPIEFAAEPSVPTHADDGATLTGAIPGRGNFQVRVEEKTDHSVTFLTVEGHPLAGTVTFSSQPMSDGVRFQVEVLARASNVVDWIALRLGGGSLQNQNWKEVVSRVIALSGGVAPEGVQSEKTALTDEEAQEAERWAAHLVRKKKRAEQQLV